ncbi:MAG: hypothetical protein G01um101431_969 [Parcubacteria group bacterium Gr01-1014_31]|nr:MAG: hypothetical protein G01um101431_969 [Parcubacteria group bacterium Gr01-1014_31]
MSISWPKIRVQLFKVFSRFYLELIILSVVIILALGYLWFIKGGWEEIRTHRRYNLLQTRTQADYLDGHLKALHTLQERKSRFNASQLERFKSLLPTEPDLPGLLVQIAEIARQGGLLVNGIQFSESDFGGGAEAATPSPETRPLSDLRTVRIDMSVSQGNYGKIKQLLTNLEANLRLIDVQSINFSAGDDTVFSISMQAYYWPR